MTDLNTNTYLYNQPYPQNQPGYGDNKTGLPINYDDKRLDPVKKDINNNLLVSTAKGFIGEPVNIAIGAVPAIAVDRLLKRLPAGENLKNSPLGKLIDLIDNSVEKLPKFEGLKKAYNNLPETNFIKQLINAKPATPRWAKGQLVHGRTQILTDMLDEAVEITKPDTTASKNILKTLTDDKTAVKEAVKLAGKNKSEEFIRLFELVKKPEKAGFIDKFFKFIGQHPSKRLLKEAIKIKETPPKVVAQLKHALENPEAAEKFLKKFGEKVAKNPEVAERFLERYKKVLDSGEFIEAAHRVTNGEKIYDIAYKSAEKLAGANASTKFKMLKNSAEFYTKEHSAISKAVMSLYNNMTTFLRFDIGKLKLNSSGARKLGGAAVMFFIAANLLGKIVKDTWDAPKKEKVSTLAHGVISDLGSWLMWMPLGTFMFKGIGSLKNLKGTNLISRAIKAPFRWAGDLMGTGLYPKKATTLPRKIFNPIKGFFGGIGRFGLFMFALTPLTDKILRFVSHSIFGKPNALLAKEKAEEEKGNTENTENSSTEALKKALAQNKAGMITVAAKNQVKQPINNNPIEEPPLKQDKKPALPQEANTKQQYIPSDTATGKIQQEKLEKKAKVDDALAKADSVIKNAENTLGSV